MADIKKHSSLSNLIRFVLKHATTGVGLTGLSSASAGLIISTITDNEATATTYTTAGSTIETITTLGTFATPTATKCRFKEVDATNHKGLYEFQFDNARFSVASSKRLVLSVTGATNLLDADYEIQLVSFDPYDSIRMGMTSLPATGTLAVNPTLAAVTHTGAVIPTVTTLTGHTAQTGDNFARLGAPAGASVSADVAAVKTDTAAIKVKTDFLPSVTAGGTGGLFIAGTNAATSITTALTANITGNLSGSVGSVTTVTSIVNGVWDEAIAGHLTAGTTGNKLNSAASAGDPWTTALPGAYGAGTAGKILGDNLNATVGSRATQTSVDTIDGIVDNILIDTAEIGAAGAGLTAIPWNIAWDAEVQSECADALNAYDPPTNTEMVAAFTEIKGATWAATDTLEAIRDRGDSAWITATGFATTAALATAQIDLDTITGADGVTLATTQGNYAPLKGGVAMTEAYAADGAAATPEQMLYMIWASVSEFAIAGTTITAKKLDGITTSMTFTLNDGTNPTSRTRAT